MTDPLCRAYVLACSLPFSCLVAPSPPRRRASVQQRQGPKDPQCVLLALQGIVAGRAAVKKIGQQRRCPFQLATLRLNARLTLSATLLSSRSRCGRHGLLWQAGLRLPALGAPSLLHAPPLRRHLRAPSSPALFRSGPNARFFFRRVRCGLDVTSSLTPPAFHLHLYHHPCPFLRMTVSPLSSD